MQAMSQTSIWLLALTLALAVCQIVHCSPVPPSEPYSYHHFDPYSYGYDVEDNYGNKQWRQEKSNHPHEVHGSYGYRDKNGVYREVTYVADKDGFRANIKTNEPGVEGAKDPASTNIESYYSAPPPAPSTPTHSYSYQPSPPVYVRQQYAASPSNYHQSNGVI